MTPALPTKGISLVRKCFWYQLYPRKSLNLLFPPLALSGGPCLVSTHLGFLISSERV